LSIYAEGEQQDESGTGEGAKRAIGNQPSQPSVIKVKSLYVNWKCNWTRYEQIDVKLEKENGQ